MKHFIKRPKSVKSSTNIVSNELLQITDEGADEVADKIAQLLESNGISYEEVLGETFTSEDGYADSDGILVTCDLDGDWKHDHDFADYLVTNNYNVASYYTDELEDSGSDSYLGRHYWFLIN